MPDTALVKVEDAVAALLRAKTELDDWEIETDPDSSINSEAPKRILVTNGGFTVDQSDCLGQSIHRTVLELAFMSGPQPLGIINRANGEAIAHAHAAIAADRYLNDMLQSLEERDVQSVADELRDVHAATLQYDVEYYTPRDDWFTIIGQGGETF